MKRAFGFVAIVLGMCANLFGEAAPKYSRASEPVQESFYTGQANDSFKKQAGGEDSPAAVVLSYHEALAAGDFAKAKSLVGSDESRNNIQRIEELVKVLSKEKDAKEFLEGLRDIKILEEEATVRFKLGVKVAVMRLVRRDGRWVIVGIVSQDESKANSLKATVPSMEPNPRTAVMSFLEAIANRDFEKALSFVSGEKYRKTVADVAQNVAKMSPDKREAFFNSIRRARHIQTVADGDKALVIYDDLGGVAHFELERKDGVWKILGERELYTADSSKKMALCRLNMEETLVSIMLWMLDNKLVLPPADGWEKAIANKKGNGMPQCPLDRRGYRYFGSGVKLSQTKELSRAILLVCPGDHEGKTLIGFADGHVEAVDPRMVKDAIDNARQGELPILK